MEIIDLYTSGKAIWAELDSVNTSFYPAIHHDATSQDNLASAFLHTEFRLSTMHYVLSEGSDGLDTLTAPVIAHPDHGVWFVHISDDDSPHPALPLDLENERDAFFHTWFAIFDEFGWDDVAFGALILFPKLDRRDCIADFSLCPMPVFFRDDLANLPNILRQHDARPRHETLSALGAMNLVGHVLPMNYEGYELECSPTLANRIWGTTTPERGLPLMH